MDGFRQLAVWQRSMSLVERCYSRTEVFPDRERYGLASQLQRAIVSVPSDIAEGHGLQSPRGFIRHLRIAHGSLAEVSTQIELAARLGYVDPNRVESLLWEWDEVSRMVFGLIKSIESGSG